jgi:hypothetical protein
MKFCPYCGYCDDLCRCSSNYGQYCKHPPKNCNNESWFDDKDLCCDKKPHHCPPKPEPEPKRDECEIVCNNTCGNLLLSDQVPNLEIWRERIGKEPTVTISVFNSAMSTASIRVLVIRNVGSPVEFTVPPGNTLSATVENAESISVFRIGTGGTEGKFCLDVCFPVFCNDKRKHKNCHSKFY